MLFTLVLYSALSITTVALPLSASKMRMSLILPRSMRDERSSLYRLDVAV